MAVAAATLPIPVTTTSVPGGTWAASASVAPDDEDSLRHAHVGTIRLRFCGVEARIGEPSTVILVEGVSDQIAVEALARAEGRDLDALQVAVVPTGGAHAIGRFVVRLGPAGAGLRLVGLCDAGEEPVVRRAIARAGADVPVFVCDTDLEDELIRAVTPAGVQNLLGAHGDLGSFRTLQKQPYWRDRPVQAQLQRFFASGSTRKLRYADKLVIAATELGRVPAPLQQALNAATECGGTPGGALRDSG